MGLLDRLFGSSRYNELKKSYMQLDERLKKLEELVNTISQDLATKEELASLHREIHNELDAIRKDVELVVDARLDEQRKWTIRVIDDVKKELSNYATLLTPPVQVGDRRKKVSDEDIIALYKKNLPISEIARLLGVTRQTIYVRLKKLEQEGKIQLKHVKGRKTDSEHVETVDMSVT